MELVESICRAKEEAGLTRPHPDLPDDPEATLYYVKSLRDCAWRLQVVKFATCSMQPRSCWTCLAPRIPSKRTQSQWQLDLMWIRAARQDV